MYIASWNIKNIINHLTKNQRHSTISSQDMKPQAFDLQPTGGQHTTDKELGSLNKVVVSNMSQIFHDISVCVDEFDGFCMFLLDVQRLFVCWNSLNVFLGRWHRPIWCTCGVFWKHQSVLLRTTYGMDMAWCSLQDQPQEWCIRSNKGWSHLENLLWPLSKLTHSKAPHNPGQVLPNLCARNWDELDLWCAMDGYNLASRQLNLMNAAGSASVSQIGKQNDNPKPAELSQHQRSLWPSFRQGRKRAHKTYLKTETEHT